MSTKKRKTRSEAKEAQELKRQLDVELVEFQYKDCSTTYMTFPKMTLDYVLVPIKEGIGHSVTVVPFAAEDRHKLELRAIGNPFYLRITVPGTRRSFQCMNMRRHHGTSKDPNPYLDAFYKQTERVLQAHETQTALLKEANDLVVLAEQKEQSVFVNATKAVIAYVEQVALLLGTYGKDSLTKNYDGDVLVPSGTVEYHLELKQMCKHIVPMLTSLRKQLE